jgi:hypothetical protein
MKKLLGAWRPKEARGRHAPVSKHHELQSIGRFRVKKYVIF